MFQVPILQLCTDKNDHVQALVPERPINVSDSITVDFSPTLYC